MPDVVVAIKAGKDKKEATRALYELGRLTGTLLRGKGVPPSS
jgi:hypothetical protein